jgi:hypothetical protein
VDTEALLDICDCVRQALGSLKTLGPRADTVSAFLNAVLKDETKNSSNIDLKIIQEARLDKLLKNITDPQNLPTPVPLRLRSDIQIAANLQRIWESKFRERYLALDQLRYHELPTKGELRDVVFAGVDVDCTERWQATHVSQDIVSELEGNLQFEPGQYVGRNCPVLEFFLCVICS